MVYITGDMHGDMERFRAKELKKLKKDDYLIVLGDFGFVWDGSKAEQKMLKWIGKRKYTVLFLDGTHDNQELLQNFPQEEWMGGQTRVVSGKLRYLCRGSIFCINSDYIFVCGGGESQDMDERISSGYWWPQEMPSEEQLQAAMKNLEERGFVVDYVLTHECCNEVKDFIDLESNRINHLNSFFSQVSKQCRFKRWFFGSYHMDKIITPTFTGVYKNILPMKK